MVSQVLITLIVFGTLFGIVYLGITSRTRIRMALIEKGADASIFRSKPTGGLSILSIILVNLALLLFFIGVAIFVAAILNKNMNLDPEVAYPGTIFIFSGLGLYVGYGITRRNIAESAARNL